MILNRCATGGAMALAFLLALGVDAQAQAPGAAGPPINYGPPINGICVVSTSDAIAASSVGKAFSDRMTQLKQQVGTELQPQETQLASEQQALQRAGTPDQAKIQAFETKADAYQKLRQQRLQELDYTYNHQLQRIALELRPVINQVFQQKNCTILLERDNVVLGVNPAMDLTTAAIMGLNARMQTITFDRETPPPGGPTGQ
jgi:outer membrane protein